MIPDLVEVMGVDIVVEQGLVEEVMSPGVGFQGFVM